MEMINSFKRYLRNIVPNIVYKSVREAEKYETKDSRINGDEYVGAMLNMDGFDAYADGSFSLDILHKVGIYDSNLIKQINHDKYNIPEEKRNDVVRLRHKEIIDNFEETNNYYRMLMGLPDVGADFIYLSPDEMETYGYYHDTMEDYNNDNLEALTPIHKLPQNVLNSMEASGYLDEVYQIYAADSNYNAEYIKHLGIRKVDPVLSRRASHFELLYVPRPENANRFNRDFSFYYDEARQYFLNQIYNFNYSAQYDFYEGYMGFFIMVMAIQRMVNSLFEVMIERDFYDIETCRMFLEAYGVPFVELFTFRQQKALVKNLNILLQNKCTSQVMYDILNILEFDTYRLTKYLLVKQHKTVQLTDEDEPVPIFIYRTTLDEDGVPTYELDKSLIYDYYFIAVDMDEKDIRLVETTDASAHRYEELTVPDAYWIEDEDLVKKLQDAEINYVETKYTDVSITIRMQKVMFEHVYLQKMLCDKESETSKIKVSIPLITYTPVSLFELEILLICLMCKHNKMVPDLIATPSKALAVLGFNFDADLEAIKEEIRTHPRIYSQQLLDYIENIQFRTVNDVNDMYGNVQALSNLLVETMQNTTSEIVYHAYKKLYTALLVTDIHQEVFKLPNGEIPETYMDWLKTYNYQLYEYVDKLSPEGCVDKINYIATKLSTWINKSEYMGYLTPVDVSVINGLIRILRWFKSYTLDIHEMEVVYLFDSRYFNLMKMMDRMWFHANGYIRETDIGFHEWVHSFSEAMTKEETENKLEEFIRMSAEIHEDELDHLMHDSFRLVATLHLDRSIVSRYIDSLTNAHTNSILKERMRLTDTRRPIRYIVDGHIEGTLN